MLGVGNTAHFIGNIVKFTFGHVVWMNFGFITEFEKIEEKNSI